MFVPAGFHEHPFSGATLVQGPTCFAQPSHMEGTNEAPTNETSGGDAVVAQAASSNGSAMGTGTDSLAAVHDEEEIADCDAVEPNPKRSKTSHADAEPAENGVLDGNCAIKPETTDVTLSEEIEELDETEDADAAGTEQQVKSEEKDVVKQEEKWEEKSVVKSEVKAEDMDFDDDNRSVRTSDFMSDAGALEFLEDQELFGEEELAILNKPAAEDADQGVPCPVSPSIHTRMAGCQAPSSALCPGPPNTVP